MVVNFMVRLFFPGAIKANALYQGAFKQVIIFLFESRNDAGTRLADDPEKRIALAGMTVFRG